MTEIEILEQEILNLEKEIESLDNEQKAVKLMINSLYGCLGNEYFRYFDKRIAEAVTLSSQYVIKYSEKTVNDYLNKILEDKKDHVIAMDTDSLYVSFEDVIKKYMDTDKFSGELDFVDSICEKRIVPLLEKAYEKMAKDLNVYEPRIVMKREVIASGGLWTTKKRYILNVDDDEGFRPEKPKMKIVGIEAIRSSTPAKCKEVMKKCFHIIMNGEEKDLHTLIAEFKKTYQNLPPHEIGAPKSVNNMTKYHVSEGFLSRTPNHVKGSMTYNRQIDRLKLENYDKIKSGDKIKTVYLKMPNPIQESEIAFPAFLPIEMNLEKYIDRKTQFEKTFLKPMQPFFDATGWHHEPRMTLF